MARVKKSFYTPSTNLKSYPVALSMEVNKRNNGSSKTGKRNYHGDELNDFSRVHSRTLVNKADPENVKVFSVKFQFKRYGDKLYCLIYQSSTRKRNQEILMGTVTPDSGFIPILDRWEEVSDKTNKTIISLHDAILSFLKYSPVRGNTEKPQKPTVKKVLNCPTAGRIKLI